MCYAPRIDRKTICQQGKRFAPICRRLTWNISPSRVSCVPSFVQFYANQPVTSKRLGSTKSGLHSKTGGYRKCKKNNSVCCILLTCEKRDQKLRQIVVWLLYQIFCYILRRHVLPLKQTFMIDVCRVLCLSNCLQCFAFILHRISPVSVVRCFLLIFRLFGLNFCYRKRARSRLCWYTAEGLLMFETNVRRPTMPRKRCTRCAIFPKFLTQPLT